jgi:hypothetical protein
MCFYFLFKRRSLRLTCTNATADLVYYSIRSAFPDAHAVVAPGVDP